MHRSLFGSLPSDAPMTSYGRGRTRAGRLAVFEQWLTHANWLPHTTLPIVHDIGLGDRPDTTLDLYLALHQRYPDVLVRGIDHHAGRVAAARLHGRPGVSFHVGGFDSGLTLGSADIIRLFNVLRGYPVDEVETAHRQLGSSLKRSGWLVDGNASADGSVIVALLLERVEDRLYRRALWFYATTEGGFSPVMLRNFLPRDLYKQARGEHPVGVFFQDWLEAWEQTRRAADCPFQASVLELSKQHDIPWESPGVAVWRPERGVACHDGVIRHISLER